MFSAKKKLEKKEAEKSAEVVDDEIDLDEALRLSRRASSASARDSGSARGARGEMEGSKRNKIYQHIKREIEMREKKKPDEAENEDQQVCMWML